MKKFTFLIILTFVCIGCSDKRKLNKYSTVQAIEEISKTIVNTWNEGNYEGFMAALDEEIVLLPQNAPPVEGYIAVSELYKNSFGAFNFEVNETIKEIKVFGDWAYEYVFWNGSMNPKDGSTPIKFNNKVICIYKKQEDTSWKMYRCMYSSNDVPEELHIPDTSVNL